MSVRFNKCDLYISVWIIHLVNGFFGFYTDAVSVSVLFFLYAWSLYYFYIALKYYRLPSLLKAWSALFVLFTIYAIVRMINPMGHSYNVGFEINSRMFLMEHWTSMLPIYPFYVFSKQGQLNENNIKRWTIVFVGVAIVRYYYGQALVIPKLSRFADKLAFTNNQGYFVAMVLPLMYFWRKKPIIQYTGIALLMAFVLLAVKRGAIIVGLLSVLIQLFSSFKQLKQTNNFRSIIIFVAIVAFSIVGYYYITYLFLTNDYFSFRWESSLEGDSSNRNDIYSSMLNAFVGFNPLSMIFGKGADGTILLFRTQAHNDWIEILIDMGIVGFSFFVNFWIRAFDLVRKTLDKESKQLFFMVIIMLFVRTLFSMSINDINITSNLILGYCLANIYGYSQE